MNEQQLAAIQLKFKGHSYKEIAEQIGSSEAVIKKWFAEAGELFEPYKEYAAQQAELILDQARNQFISQVPLAQKVIANALAEELKYIERFKEKHPEDRPDYSVAVELAEKIIDRGGLTIIRKTESTVKNSQTYDELIEHLKQRGLRSDGHRAAPVATSN